MSKNTYSCSKNGLGYLIKANNKPLKTLKNQALFCPRKPLAEGVIQQLNQYETQAPLYRLLSLSIDLDKKSTISELVSYADTDLVCYFAPEPPDLLAWQEQHWVPVINFVKKALNFSSIITTSQALPIEQDADFKMSLSKKLGTFDNYELAALYVSGKLLGSVLTALGFASGAFTADEAHKIAMADDYYQQSRYGEDEQLKAELIQHLKQLEELAHFLKLIKQEKTFDDTTNLR